MSEEGKDSNAASGEEEAEVNICTTPGCGKVALMACPTCNKLGLPPAPFCGQECFKGYWSTHKMCHKVPVDPLTIPTNFRYFQFTGPLRPAQQSPRRPVPPDIPLTDYANHPGGVSESEQKDRRANTSIKVYNEEELAGIRKACVIGREVLDAAGAAVAVGVTTDELDRIVHEETIKRKAYPSPLNYYKFPKSVCTSVNEVICHGIPDYRPLEEGDIVNLDISVYHEGYHADLNETFFVGKQDEDSLRLVECAYNALAAGIAHCRPGALYRDIGQEIYKVTKNYGCSIVKSYCGHGIGTLFHTAPNIPHYPKNKAKGAMQVGHVFTIEPMINLGGWEDVTWPDNWTAVTRDGSRSSQFERKWVSLSFYDYFRFRFLLSLMSMCPIGVAYRFPLITNHSSIFPTII